MKTRHHLLLAPRAQGLPTASASCWNSGLPTTLAPRLKPWSTTSPCSKMISWKSSTKKLKMILLATTMSRRLLPPISRPTTLMQKKKTRKRKRRRVVCSAANKRHRNQKRRKTPVRTGLRSKLRTATCTSSTSVPRKLCGTHLKSSLRFTASTTGRSTRTKPGMPSTIITRCLARPSGPSRLSTSSGRRRRTCPRENWKKWAKKAVPGAPLPKTLNP
mmetsp:Transcript_2269/g.3061  ORF Transcript_2269/g.3061 Transcript_2269/m.3061 type:complete len:217 (-) Transcript_2269:452-1102(-)